MVKNLTPYIHQAYSRLERVIYLSLVTIVAAAPIILLNQTASAAQVTNRSLLISNGQAGGTSNYTFTFTPGSTSQVQSIKFESCTTALGTCTAPTGINLSGGTVGQSGFQGATSFTKDTATSGCTTVDVLCVTRSDATSQTLTAHVITDTGATNQNSSNCSGNANCTFFIRITTFSDTAYTTSVDNGTVASSTTQLFTVNAAVEEQLSFCIGATTIDDSNTNTPPACSGISGTSLNLGVLDSGHTNVSPVPSGSLNGDGNNAIGELSTNAVNGTTVSYDAVQQSGTNHQGTLRVAGASCNSGSINTDQCINAVGTTEAHIVAGTENFGMTIAAINCKATTAYSCSFTAGTYNLVRNANYNGTGSNTYPTDSGQVTGTSNAFYAWDESGSAATIASSSTVVDKEAMILKFAATPNIVTPTGSYTAKADFVATPTF